MADLVPVNVLEKNVRGAIVSIDTAQVYHLYRGRNAWRTVWTEHYFHGVAIHTAAHQARARAERLRERGSVFYIKVLPAILVKTTRGRLIAAQIWSTDPFRYYLLQPEFEHRGERVKLPIVLRGGGVASHFLSSLQFVSDYWREPPRKDSIHVLRIGSAHVRLEKLSSAVGMTWKSRSVGPQSSLRWDEWEGTERVTGKCVRSLVNRSRGI
jgi:hypothetical protein